MIVVDFGKLILRAQMPMGLKDFNEAGLVRLRLYDQPTVVLRYQDFGSRQFKLDRDADCLVSAISKETGRSLSSGGDVLVHR